MGHNATIRVQIGPDSHWIAAYCRPYGASCTNNSTCTEAKDGNKVAFAADVRAQSTNGPTAAVFSGASFYLTLLYLNVRFSDQFL
jgi:hypothetical protein